MGQSPFQSAYWRGNAGRNPNVWISLEGEAIRQEVSELSATNLLECEESDRVYCYMNKLADMIDNDNSYIRTRGLTLIACNAKWDKDDKIHEIIDEYLKHIEDVKPITAGQCIKLLPMIAKNKPELKCDIVSSLQKADISIYADSMQSLVYKDIQSSLAEIEKL